jgi:hypothetical protein
MSFGDILIIVGCAALGWWIVRSVMDPGVDANDQGRGRAAREPPAAPPSGVTDPMPDWYIVLDVSPDASRADIQSAVKRRLAQAEANGDRAAITRISRAAETGLKPRPR